MGAAVVLQSTKVDDLCGPPSVNSEGVTEYKSPKVKPSTLSFDKGDVWTTGWMTTSMGVPDGMQGQRVRLTLQAYDVGDSIYDTAVLLDDVTLKTK